MFKFNSSVHIIYYLNISIIYCQRSDEIQNQLIIFLSAPRTPLLLHRICYV